MGNTNLLSFSSDEAMHSIMQNHRRPSRLHFGFLRLLSFFKLPGFSYYWKQGNGGRPNITKLESQLELIVWG